MSWRYRFVLAAFFFMFMAILLRLFYWQVIRADELRILGQEQYGRFLQISPKRGEILASDGFPVAANKLSYLVYANPKEVKGITSTARLLSPVLEEEEASLTARLGQDRFWVPLKNQIPHEIKKEVELLAIKGLGFEEQSIRLYPEASMAAHLLGFVGKNEFGQDQGYFGLEGYYDRQLRGKSASSRQIFDALGQPILARMEGDSQDVPGRSLTLHVDRVAQFVLEEELKDGIERYGAKTVQAAIMDPSTGAILAMASFPTFDPRDYSEFSDELYKNPFITNTYEPGSTFKPLVMAAAIDKEVLEPHTRCDICDGPVSLGGYKIKTWNDKYQANQTMIDVIKNSDNTGMVFVSQKLELDGMVEYLGRFGIGELTGIDLQGEEIPSMREADSWYPIDVATASFGQGISVTPIELLSAFSTLANEGRRMEPHVVKSITTEDGEIIEISPKIINQPVSAKTAKIMTEILVTSAQAGEAKWAAPKGYRIAGKTGTAQIPIAGHYDPSQTIASFIGFAPADDPRFVMLVIVDRPTSSIYGSETAAPIFFRIATRLLMHMGIPPTQTAN